MTAQMRIGEVADRADVPTSTIRYYERIGVLPPAQRVNGQRVFGADVLELLEAINIAQDLGFTLDETKLLLGSFRSDEDPSRECRELVEQKLEELEAIVARARKMKGILEHGLSCRCSSLQSCQLIERHRRQSTQKAPPLRPSPSARSVDCEEPAPQDDTRHHRP